MSNSFQLKIHNISKQFEDFFHLNQINLTLENQKIYGIVGRNGSGKTTLLDLISGRIFPDSGDITVVENSHSKPIVDIDNMICYFAEYVQFPPKLTANQLLDLSENTFPHFRADYALQHIKKLNIPLNHQITHFSLGQITALRNILGLSSNTPITIFDEPTLGLDVHSRDLFITELIETFNENPRMFIITTHLIEEFIDVFNDVIILQNGNMIFDAEVDLFITAAFYVSGKAEDVDAYISDKRVLNESTTFGKKTAVIQGERPKQSDFQNIEFSSISVHKLFDYMTESEVNRG